MLEPASFVPYPAIEQHGVIGDRASAALVAADGTLDWLCLPRYDGYPIFGAILDAAHGGWWRFGPAARRLGRQWYETDTPVLVTEWDAPDGLLRLTDVFAGPGCGTRARAVIRKLRCEGGRVDCVMHFEPWHDLSQRARIDGRGAVRAGDRLLRFWSDAPCRIPIGTPTSRFRLSAGDEVWAVLDIDHQVTGREEARQHLDDVRAYWRAWTADLEYRGTRAAGVRRAAITIHLLGCDDRGAVVAAATTSLPERIGGPWNADYRFAWIRDSALTFGSLAALGDTRSARRYLDWVVGLPEGPAGAPLQVLYRVDGGSGLRQMERRDVDGYRGSRPVRIGNHAYRQRQLDQYGYLIDCLLQYLERGGAWHQDYWRIARRCADFTCDAWMLAGNGIWELAPPQFFVSSRVMSWVTLERAQVIGRRLGEPVPARWRSTAEQVRGEVLRRGFGRARRAFRQRYAAEGLDASALLVPIYDFLPVSDPRVRDTATRIENELTIDHFVHRFEPRHTAGVEDLPLGQCEGAFLPCTFWLATARAKMGDAAGADHILTAAERVAGPLGIFAEGVDARTHTFLGNTPLLFSHAEYIRAVLTLDRAEVGTPVDHQCASMKSRQAGR